MSARVEWLVRELEEENSSLQLEVKSLQEERDLLERQVDDQRRLLTSCVQEVLALKEELSQLMTSLDPAATAEQQRRLCERLARHVSEIEREVAARGARAEERRDAAVAELRQQLEEQRREGGRLGAELQLARTAAERQAEEHRSRVAELEEMVDAVTKQKASVEESRAKETEALKRTVREAEDSLRAARGSQEQLAAARRQQERLSRQLAETRDRLAEVSRQLAERSGQLADAARAAEVKAAQLAGMKTALHDSKARNAELQKDLADKAKQIELQVGAISRKDDIIRRQKFKLENVAKDLNKLKSVFSDSNLPGLCECNEAAIGGSMRDLRALRGGRPPSPCPARQLRATIAQQKKRLESSEARTKELESTLDDLRQKLPQMSAEADRAYAELQAKLQQQQTTAARAQTQLRDQQRRSQQLVLQLAAATGRLRDSEQLAQRLRQESRSAAAGREQQARTAGQLQAALHETVQLTARLQAARAELDAERRLTEQMRRRLDQADRWMKGQLETVVKQLQEMRRAEPGRQVDWPGRYAELLDRCQEWQEECLARQRDCADMEQRLGTAVKQGEAGREQRDELSGGGGAEEAQLARLERQLQTLATAVSRVPASRARSEPEMPVPRPRSAGRRQERPWSGRPADTSSGSVSTAAASVPHPSPPGVRPSPPSDNRPTPPSCNRPTPPSTNRPTTPSNRPTAPSNRPTPLFGNRPTPPPGDRPTATPPSGNYPAPSQKTGSGAGSSGVSVAVPELAPLLQRVTEIVTEVERQRDQLVAQGHLLEEYRSRERGEEEEEPCRDGESGRAGCGRSVSTGRGGEGSPEAAAPELAELRAQWRHLETLARDRTESARTRSDVVLRLSGLSSEQSQ